MEVNIQPADDGTTTLAVSGDITVKNYRQLTEAVEMLSSLTVPPQRVVLDCAAVSYIDSVGLGALIKVFTVLKRANCPLILRHINDTIRRSLITTKLDTLLTIE